jgi:hypothetical protein
VAVGGALVAVIVIVDKGGSVGVAGAQAVIIRSKQSAMRRFPVSSMTAGISSGR